MLRLHPAAAALLQYGLPVPPYAGLSSYPPPEHLLLLQHSTAAAQLQCAPHGLLDVGLSSRQQ
jgi:hypothetical protein